MFTIVSAHSPVYTAEDGSRIDLVVKFAEFDEEMAFTAAPEDLYTHTVELYNRAIAGEFGAIAPYSAITPVAP